MSPEASALATPLLWIIFGAAALVSAILGIIIAYHWTRFSANPVLSFFTIAVYAGGCVVLLGIMFASVVALTF